MRSLQLAAGYWLSELPIGSQEDLGVTLITIIPASSLSPTWPSATYGARSARCHFALIFLISGWVSLRIV